jgi:hypothetical protein
MSWHGGCYLKLGSRDDANGSAYDKAMAALQIVNEQGDRLNAKRVEYAESTAANRTGTWLVDHAVQTVLTQSIIMPIPKCMGKCCAPTTEDKRYYIGKGKGLPDLSAASTVAGTSVVPELERASAEVAEQSAEINVADMSKFVLERAVVSADVSDDKDDVVSKDSSGEAVEVDDSDDDSSTSIASPDIAEYPRFASLLADTSTVVHDCADVSADVSDDLVYGVCEDSSGEAVEEVSSDDDSSKSIALPAIAVHSRFVSLQPIAVNNEAYDKGYGKGYAGKGGSLESDANLCCSFLACKTAVDRASSASDFVDAEPYRLACMQLKLLESELIARQILYE